MRFGIAIAAAFGCMTASTAPAADDAMPAPVDYAYGWTIDQSAQSGFHEFDLTLEVYRSVADPGLRDVGVYDARGVPVPRLISAPVEPVAAPDEVVEKTLMPVNATPGTRVADMRLALERSGTDTSVRIESVASSAGAAPQALVAYLADLGEPTTRLRAVEFDWPREIEPVITQLTIEGSEDLDHWNLLGNGTVAGLSQDDARIERRRVDLQFQQVRYLRISWSRAPPGWRLTRLVARYSQAPQPVLRQTETLWPSGRDPDDGGWLYELGGAPQVDRIGILLPENEDLVRVSVYAWETSGQYWRQLHNGLFYRLRREGDILESEPVASTPVRASRWKLVIERGSPEAQLGLALGWRPDRLLFLAQGEGPWQLVAGSAHDELAGFPQARRYSDPEMRGLLKNAGPVGTATLQARASLGGEARLVPSQSPEWRRWMLWIGLVAGVLLVGFMALRLLRQPAG